MSDSHRPGQRPSAGASQRDLAVDVTRGLALVSMLIAHTAPSNGPGGLLWISEWLTAPLFATLIGMGSWLGWRRVGPGARHARRRFLAAVAVRAVALVGIGLLLEQLENQVIIVLVPLGVLTLVAALVAWLPTGAVALTGVVATLGGTLLRTELAPLELRLAADGHWAARIVDVLATGYAYRVTHLLAWACLGIILARRQELTRGFLGSRPRDHQDPRGTWHVVRGDALLAGSALALAAPMMLALYTERITMRPYIGTNPEVLFDALLCTGVVCGTAALLPLLPRPVVAPLASAGAMMLTLYVAQILVLSAFVALTAPGTPDDSWAMLVGLTVGLLGFATTWRAFVRTGPFTRGPIEGLIGLASHAAARL